MEWLTARLPNREGATSPGAPGAPGLVGEALPGGIEIWSINNELLTRRQFDPSVLSINAMSEVKPEVQHEIKSEADEAGSQSNRPSISSDSTSDSITAMDYISSQLDLEREAKELMPYDPNTCTYTMGALRQQIYACMDCYRKTNKLSGICYSCSIQCHSDHELVELFTKRQFTCDCGTTRMDHSCNLRSKVKDDIPSSSNDYNQNFKGLFCTCAKIYNPFRREK